jgi:hypothetical protein
MLQVTPHTSLELPGRAARSRGRTSTGEFQRIHGMLSGTFFYAASIWSRGETKRDLGA